MIIAEALLDDLVDVGRLINRINHTVRSTG